MIDIDAGLLCRVTVRDQSVNDYILFEEMGELAQSISKLKRGEGTIPRIVEEMAHVYYCLEKLATEYFINDRDIYREIHKKENELQQELNKADEQKTTCGYSENDIKNLGSLECSCKLHADDDFKAEIAESVSKAAKAVDNAIKAIDDGVSEALKGARVFTSITRVTPHCKESKRSCRKSGCEKCRGKDKP